MIRALLPVAFAAALGAQSPPAAAPATRMPFCTAARGAWPRDSIARLPAPLVPAPEPVRGLYVNRWAAIGSRLTDLIAIAERTEINALVIDVKDDRGLLLYRSEVPLARAIGADTTLPLRRDKLRAALDTMRAHGIYPIARIVVAKDPLLAMARPQWAVRSRADSTLPWRDREGLPWLDAHQPGPWRYAAELACEAVDLGFSELQFDYVRFPDDAGLVRDAVFPLARGRARAQVIHDQLSLLRARLRPLRVPVTADVFGLTTTDTTDMGIGQRWELLVTAVDVVLPMVYPSHYAPGEYGLSDPNGHPAAVVRRALTDAKARSATIPGAAAVRPWYQDFTLGAPKYGSREVRAQIDAGYAVGVKSWLLWNARSVYSVGALREDRSQQSRINGQR